MKNYIVFSWREKYLMAYIANVSLSSSIMQQESGGGVFAVTFVPWA